MRWGYVSQIKKKNIDEIITQLDWENLCFSLKKNFFKHLLFFVDFTGLAIHRYPNYLHTWRDPVIFQQVKHI